MRAPTAEALASFVDVEPVSSVNYYCVVDYIVFYSYLGGNMELTKEKRLVSVQCFSAQKMIFLWESDTIILEKRLHLYSVSIVAEMVVGMWGPDAK